MAGLHPRSAMSLPFSLSASFRNLSLACSKRSFSSTTPARKLYELPPECPPYPYGPNQWYRQSNTGLYGGAMIQFGNKISDGRNKGKTRRSFKPNVRRKMIYSEALGKNLFIKVTQRALRTINKAGGLDNYLLDDRPCRVKEMGIFGWHLRWQIMQTPKIQEKFSRERKKLGIPPPPTFGEWMKQNKPNFKEEVEKGTNIKGLTRPTYNWKVH
ncbi:hypothetical protein PHISCL_04589 [Aspergillus sclerotialis]|uniref:Large ribosomal subunit protein bL28m n=1 Tax=Aspergillus sclerotialis TaxID=2070753 RepID=A0A3A2ZKH8_9EURO|nr:hypothetical protein PHISCL_04589 [Aspergillus sclerotialis]